MLRVFIIILTLAATNVIAQDAQWSGFGTLGVTMSDSNTYGYRSDLSGDDGVFAGDVDLKSLSILGAQVEKSFSPTIDMVAQVALRDIGEADAHNYLTMAFLRYVPSANWSFRAGRLTPDLFMITEYRNINLAYTWANVPNEIYGMIPFKYIDGADFTYSQQVNNGTLNFKLFAGQSEALISALGDSELTKLKNMFGTSLIYDQNDWNIQARFTRAEIDSESEAVQLLSQQIEQIPDFIWPDKENMYSQFVVKGEEAQYLSLSGQKYWQQWLFSFELAMLDSDSDMIQQNSSGYISAAYQHNLHTFYSVFARTTADQYIFTEDIREEFIPNSNLLIDAIETAMNFYSSNQQTISFGWRWDVTSTVTSKLQINTTNIDDSGGTLWLNPTNSKAKKTVSSLMYTLSFAL